MAFKRKSTQAERMKAIMGITQSINKKAGETIIGTIDDEEIMEKLAIDFIPTASYRLNSAFNGWPRGRFSIATGTEDSGKTSRLLEDIGFNMKNDPDFTVCWIESEHSLSDELIEMFGIDKKRFVYFETGTISGEEVLDYAILYANTGVDMVVINSLKCLTPEKEFKDSMKDANVAIQARMNAKFMRMVIPVITESGTALVAVQHMGTDIGSYMGGLTMSGGRSIRYGNHLTVEFKKASIPASHPLYNVKDDYMLIRAKVLKNHCRTTVNPYVTTEYIVKRGYGTDVTGEIVEEAFNQGILVKAGAWIREYNDGIIEKGNERTLEDGTKASWNGMAKLTEYINNNPYYFDYLKNRVAGNMQVESLSIEEIEKLKEEAELEALLCK